jgi:Fic family protein
MIFQEPHLQEAEERVLGLIRSIWLKLRFNLQNRPSRWSGLLARNLLADGARGSISIEGYLVSKEDALAVVDGVGITDDSAPALTALVDYRDAMNYVLRLAHAPDFAYSRDLIRSLHYIMMRHADRANPGAWRPGPIYVRNSENGELVYEPPPAEQVPGLVRELLEYLRKREDHTPTRMVRAAMAHLNLTMIHPFSDGNGRMARCLQTLVLARGDVLDPTFSSIEEYLGAHRQNYYNVLEQVGQGSWQPDRDALPWVDFCLVAHYRQARTAQRKLNAIAAIGEEIDQELVRRSLPDRCAPALVNAALGETLKNPSYRQAADVSLTVASRDLRLLADSGLLTAIGKKRGASYKAASILTEIASRHVDRSEIEDPFDVPSATHLDLGSRKSG